MRPVYTGIALLIAFSPAGPSTAQTPAEPVAQTLAPAVGSAPAGTAADNAAPSEDGVAGNLAVTSGIDVVVASAYVWRGFVLVDDATVQPNLWLKVGNLTVTSWLNIASTRPNGDHLTEHDFTADYTVTRGRTAYSAGYVNYAFPDLDRDRVTHEFYVGVSHASYFAPSLRVYHDVRLGAGTYVSLATSHSYGLPWRDAAVTPSVAIGYNHHQWIEASAFSDVAFGLKARVPTPWTRVSLTPFVTWSQSLARQRYPSRAVYGIGLSVQ